MAESSTLPLLVRDIRRRWKIALAVTVALVAGVVAYAQSLPNEYRSTVTVAFSPKPGSSFGGDTLRVVLPKYVAFVTAPATTRRVAAAEHVTSAKLSSALSASIGTDSGNLEINVRTDDPNEAARLVNAMASEVTDFAAADPLLDAVVVAPALADNAPVGPPRKLLAAAGVVVGALLGCAIAFLLERGRPRIRTWKDINVITGYPVVGRVPQSRTFKSAPIEALADPEVGAAVRTLRTNLERLSRERPVHVLVVTSSLAGEGKTTVAASLAVTLARLEADVLLVDGDLRRPSVASTFGLGSVEGGLSDLLRGKVTLHQAVRPSSMRRLSLLPTAPDSDAGDLLARRFTEVVNEARARFDVIVVDAPPLLGGDDARTLATMCDGVLFVVSSETLTASVSEAAHALEGLGVRVLGAVGNKVRHGADGGVYGTYA